MSKYPVTQKEWYEVMGSNIRQQRDLVNTKWSIRGEGDNYPMYFVSWFEAVDYCNARSIKEGLTPAYTRDKNNVTWNRDANGYRLPTEAEWEYACRAGTSTTYTMGNTINESLANFNGTGTKPVGSFQPNNWGLYDMHGNVWEWCWDRYGRYSNTSQIDPDGSSSGSSRVTRGGCWNNNSSRILRSANRNDLNPNTQRDGIGFRVVRPLN
jgi:formylglycine-generating enzyme required for sulfatase activity